MTQTTQAHFVRRSEAKRLVIATLPRPRPRQSSCRDSCQILTHSSMAKELKTSMWKSTYCPGTLVIKLIRDPCLDEPFIFLLPFYPRPCMFNFFFRPAKFFAKANNMSQPRSKCWLFVSLLRFSCQDFSATESISLFVGSQDSIKFEHLPDFVFLQLSLILRKSYQIASKTAAGADTVP